MIAIMVMSSCSFFDDDKSSKETTEVRTIVELPDSIKQKIVGQDALMTELLNKVDTLTAELNATKTENAELKEKVAELKSPKSTWAYVSMGAFVLGLIALLFALSVLPLLAIPFPLLPALTMSLFLSVFLLLYVKFRHHI